jgi:uncharacterized protein (TIGR00251 family)
LGEKKRIKVRISTNAKVSRIEDWHEGTDNRYLKISIKEPPEKGKANKALISLLAKHYRVPKSSIILVRGHTTRDKIIDILQ